MQHFNERGGDSSARSLFPAFGASVLSEAVSLKEDATGGWRGGGPENVRAQMGLKWALEDSVWELRS